MSNEQRGFQFYGKTPSGVETTIVLDIDPGKSPAEIADYLKDVDAQLKRVGFTRSDRLDKPAGGWGGGRSGAPRPEEKPPEDLVVPEHCGQPMVYKPPKEATGDKKPVAARWECRKGRDCAEAEERGGNKYPATNWHLTPKPGASTPGAEAPANGAASGVASAKDLGDFWTEARGLGFSPEDVTKHAGPEVKIGGGWTNAGLMELLNKLKAAKSPAPASKPATRDGKPPNARQTIAMLLNEYRTTVDDESYAALLADVRKKWPVLFNDKGQVTPLLLDDDDAGNCATFIKRRVRPEPERAAS